MSLRWKIAAALASLAGIVAAFAALGSYLTAKDQLARTIDDSLIERAGSALSRPPQLGEPRSRGFDNVDVPTSTEPGAGERDARPFGRPLRCPQPLALRSINYAQLLAPDGGVTACGSGSAIPVNATDRAVATGDLSAFGDNGPGDGTAGIRYIIRTETIAGEQTRVITATSGVAGVAGGALQLARETREVDRVLGRLGIRLLVIALASIAAAAAIGFALATRIVRPIRHLTTTAQHIADSGDLTTPIPDGGTDEIGSLSSSFRTMVSSLATSQEQQKRLISDASHEMRTPLTSMRTNLELLARAEQQPAARLPVPERSAVINDLQFETQELTTLLTELVELATDRSAGGEEVELVELESLCQGVIDRAVRRTGRTITIDDLRPGDARIRPAGPTPVRARPHQIERAVMNLVENAIKYSPDATSIELRVDGGRVTVRDHGPGISEEDIPRIFDRFYRATAARTQPGSGLGLAIVEQIVTGHEGTVFASNHPLGGAEVGFELPLVTGD